MKKNNNKSIYKFLYAQNSLKFSHVLYLSTFVRKMFLGQKLLYEVYSTARVPDPFYLAEQIEWCWDATLWQDYLVPV